eukprot:1117959-Amphidinium_carterae.1
MSSHKKLRFEEAFATKHSSRLFGAFHGLMVVHHVANFSLIHRRSLTKSYDAPDPLEPPKPQNN